MARRRATGPQEGRASWGQGERVLVPARRLVTAEGALWREPWTADPRELAGAIVRVKPSRDADRDEVQRVREKFLNFGAAAVRVVARAAEAVVVDAYNELAPAQDVREVVEQMAEEANTQDRDALKRVLESALARAGL